MSLAKDLLNITGTRVVPELRDFRQHIDPAWIEEALDATGTATIRRRRLPAEQVVWLVIGMALMRDRPIAEVVSALDLCLPAPGRTEVAPSAVVNARSRLGAEPIAYLFERTAEKWAYERALQLTRGVVCSSSASTGPHCESPTRTRIANTSGWPVVVIVATADTHSYALLA